MERGDDGLKKKLFLILHLILVITISLTGCAQKDKNAKELLLDLSSKSPIVKSYTFEQNIDLFFDMQGKTNISETLSNIQMIPELHIDLLGKQVNSPKQLEGEINTRTTLNGREFTYDTPYYFEQNNLYLQLPSIVTNFMPNPSRKFLSLDLSKQLIGNQRFLNDFPLLLREIAKRLNDGAFEMETDKGILIPDGEINNIISINITQENLKNFLKSVSKDDLITLLNLAIKYTDVEEQKNILNEWIAKVKNNSDILTVLHDSIDQYINIENLKFTTFYDKEGFQRKILIDLDIFWYINNDETFQIKGTIEKNIKDINQEVIFDKEIPNTDQIIDINDLNQIQDININ